jgi:purine nucleosidase
MSPTPLILDVDTGVDDALALLHAAASPEVELIGATTVMGNVTVEVATNTLAVLELLAWATSRSPGGIAPAGSRSRAVRRARRERGSGMPSRRFLPGASSRTAARFLVEPARERPERSCWSPRARSPSWRSRWRRSRVFPTCWLGSP